MFFVLSGNLSDCQCNSSGNEGSGALFTLKKNAASYKGLVMAGYEGWFNTEGDGAGSDNDAEKDPPSDRYSCVYYKTN